MPPAYPPPAKRRLITLFAMAAAVMNQIDTTIANVALPHMQGSTSASREEITWVLTSYMVASAITMPLTGWLANQFGRKRLLLISIVGFTIVSGLCGTANTLYELIGFRVLQGIFGSALIPMGQATLLDINPPEKHGSAMAIFGLAAIAGPLIGPLAGGWLTDHFSWRWVFYINLPIGIISFFGLSAVMTETKKTAKSRLDFFGFGTLALALGGFQLALDRGQSLDWFDSREVQVEAVLSLLGLYMFVVHGMTARKPFISPAIFKDRNFAISSAIGFALGILLYSAMSQIPPMMAELMGYPLLGIGMVMAPRGLGTMVGMLTMGRLINRIDPRLLVCIGLLLTAVSMRELSHLSLESDANGIIFSGMLQGVAASFVFVPLMTLAFTTLPPHLRNEASAMGSLTRNMGGSVGIAIMQVLTLRNAATVHARLTEELRPDNPLLAFARPTLDWTSPLATAGMLGEIQRQALMVSYVDTFWVLWVIGLIAAPCVWVLKSPKPSA